MAVAVGSSIFFSLALLTISLLVVLLLRYYLPLRSTPAYILVPVFLALALPASIILLVPIDLASHSSSSSGIWLPDRALLVSWRISYWLTFILTWAILPLLGEYSDSGYREPKDRLIYSLKSNGRYQLIVLTSGSIGLVYFIMTSGFSVWTLKAMAMSLAYIWGLVLAIYLMGHGLVALPRRLKRDADIAGRLLRLQTHAPSLHERLTDSVEKLEEYEATVAALKQRKPSQSPQFQDWIDELVDMIIPTSDRVENGSVPGRAGPRGSVPAVITERFLADLTRKLKRAKHAKLRFADEWSRLVTEAADLQAILDSKATKKLTFTAQSSDSSRLMQRIGVLNPYTRYLLHAQILPILRYFFALFLGLASVAIIWTEVVKVISPTLSIIGWTVLGHKTPEFDRITVGFPSQVVASAWLVYMITCALYSISEVKVWGNRALVRRQTYSESATWYSLQVTKLTVPLAYNFMTCLPTQVHEATVFYTFFGRVIETSPLFGGFSLLLPICILVPVALAFFGLYRKIGSLVGFGTDMMEDDDEENPSGFGTGGWREGRTLIERELTIRGTAAPSRSTHPPQDTLGLPRYRDDPSPRPSLNVTRSSAAAQVQRREPEAFTDEDSGDSNFFSDFATRVRNTFETTDRPAWLDNLRPKWLDNNESQPQEGRTLGGWFGGGNNGGAGRGRITL